MSLMRLKIPLMRIRMTLVMMTLMGTRMTLVMMTMRIKRLEVALPIIPERMAAPIMMVIVLIWMATLMMWVVVMLAWVVVMLAWVVVMLAWVVVVAAMIVWVILTILTIPRVGLVVWVILVVIRRTGLCSFNLGPGCLRWMVSGIAEVILHKCHIGHFHALISIGCDIAFSTWLLLWFPLCPI